MDVKRSSIELESPGINPANCGPVFVTQVDGTLQTDQAQEVAAHDDRLRKSQFGRTGVLAPHSRYQPRK